MKKSITIFKPDGTIAYFEKGGRLMVKDKKTKNEVVSIFAFFNTIIIRTSKKEKLTFYKMPWIAS